ncbi:hypothetical protein SO694_00047158 [Aureococcus anophagefferens]|uniref:USP domain-containing protein n=1 Tax=Aureococcus anophagefferens TaxID=44056 RepID=A0ABR1G7L5_AURAN
MFGVLARNAFILAELKKQKQGCLLRDGHGASVDADLVAALDGSASPSAATESLRDLNPKGQGFCALALESADLSTITDVSGYVEKGLEKGTLLRRGRELMDARPRGAAVAAWRAARALAPAPVAAPPVSAWAARAPSRLDRAASHEPAPAPLWSREDPPGSPPPPHADVPPLFAAAGATPHYTALVRDKRADAWTWYDRRDVTLVGSFESMVAKCRNDGGAPLCPYLLFYDAPA